MLAYKTIFFNFKVKRSLFLFILSVFKDLILIVKSLNKN